MVIKKLWLLLAAVMFTATAVHPLSLPNIDWFKAIKYSVAAYVSLVVLAGIYNLCKPKQGLEIKCNGIVYYNGTKIGTKISASPQLSFEQESNLGETNGNMPYTRIAVRLYTVKNGNNIVVFERATLDQAWNVSYEQDTNGLAK